MNIVPLSRKSSISNPRRRRVPAARLRTKSLTSVHLIDPQFMLVTQKKLHQPIEPGLFDQFF